MLKFAEYLSFGLGVYVLIGLVFGLYFIIWGIRREPIAGKGVLLRFMLLPGAILVWPLLLRKKDETRPS